VNEAAMLLVATQHQAGRAKVHMCFAVKWHPSEAKDQKTIDLKTSLCAADECVEPKGYMNESDSLLLHHAANR
jgi:hypothetical protein